MTIAERKAREEYDRANPWRPLREMTTDLYGHICELRVSMYNTFEDMGLRRFFYDGEAWYQIEPPRKLYRYEPIVEFRSRGIVLSKWRQRSVIERSDSKYEWRGGRMYEKPKKYKLYWRADDN
ncbi:MAG: hypothetical protein IBJ07_12350 [Rhizobiaceae bacterium]|nr:hypothetical protein [Rhizobiaceae bacterium]